MTPEFKAKWVAALRSGKYQQGRDALRTGDMFCCLGVACDLIDPDAWERDNGYGAWQELNTDGMDLPFIGNADAETLSGMNDSGYTFEEIADYIEAHVI